MLCIAKHYLNKRFLLMLYYSIIHTDISYGNITWGSNNRTHLKKINSLQKHAEWMICCKGRFANARQLFRETKILNVFQLNIWNILVYMHKIYLKQHQNYVKTSSINQLRSILHILSTSNYNIPPFKLSKSKYRISIRGPTLCYGRTFLQTVKKC